MADDAKRTGGEPAARLGAMNPGDDAPPGTPGTGENLCPACGGAKLLDGKPCPTCGGTGLVVEGVGGG